MRVVVVYETALGATRAVADAVAQGVLTADPSDMVDVVPAHEASADLVRGADLVVVGCPTHFWGIPSRLSRWEIRTEAHRGGFAAGLQPGVRGPGLREWLGGLPRVSTGRAAAFDTRLDGWGAARRRNSGPPSPRPSFLVGGAAPAIARRLRRLGYTLAARPEGFIVYEGDEGCPLRDGESDRAEAWGRELRADVPAP